MAFCNKIL